MFYNISYDVLYVNTIRKFWPDVPKRLKINGLITPDSHEFPRLIHSLFRDTSQTPGGLKRARYRSRANRNVWSAALSQAKNESDRMVCANVFGLRWSTKAPGLDGMRCALVLFSNAAWKGFSGLQVSRAPGSTVVSSHSSPADLAENHPLRSSRWSVDVGIANAISKPGLSQASSAGQSCCSCTDHDRWPIGLVLGEHSPGHARQLIR
jgi:hypothetical protein